MRSVQDRTPSLENVCNIIIHSRVSEKYQKYLTKLLYRLSETSILFPRILNMPVDAYLSYGTPKGVYAPLYSPIAFLGPYLLVAFEYQPS